MPVTAVGLACCPVPTGLSCAGTAGGEGRAHTTRLGHIHLQCTSFHGWVGCVFGGQCNTFLGVLQNPWAPWAVNDLWHEPR